MANYVSKATGNWLTVGTWYNVEDQTRGVQATHSASTDTTTGIVYNADAQDFTGTNLKDCVGLLMFCNQKTATGTVKVSLSADSGTTETTSLSINATDLPTSPSWVFFKFASALTLDGGTDYAIGIYGSSAGNATFYRDSTTANWTHLVVWSTSPAALAAADCFYVAGVQTGAGAETACVVTMDETATTDYGTVDIGNIGTLSYSTSSAANPYLRLSGNLNVWGDGVLSIGAGTPIPRDSVAVLEFDPAADGDFGLIVNNGATFNSQGLSRTSGKNVVSGKLNVDTVNTETHFHLDTDSGWLSGDVVGIASTSRTYSQCETKVLDGNAEAEVCNVTVAFGATVHSGTSPTQAEVVNLTRNVRIRSTSSTLMTYLNFKATSTVDMDWTEIYYIGENATGKKGIEIDTTTGSCNIAYSSIHDTEDYAVYTSSSTLNNLSFTYNVLYNCSSITSPVIYVSAATSGTSITFDHNIMMLSAVSGGFGMTLLDMGGTITNNTFCGINGSGINFSDSGTTGAGTISDITCHSCATYGVTFGSQVNNTTFTNFTIWRNNNYGWGTGSSVNFLMDVIINGLTMFGNSGANFAPAIIGVVTIINGVFSGDSSFATTDGYRTVYGVQGEVRFYNCTFGVAGGIKVAHTNDIYPLNNPEHLFVYLNNCKLDSTVEVLSQDYMSQRAFICSAKHDQQKGSHKTWRKYGTISVDTTANMYRTASPSERLTPNNASGKLESGSKKVAVADGGTLTPSVYVRESVVGDGTDYNGNRIRLILKRNDAIGITADAVLATATVASEGAFQQLTAATAAATDDGVMEFVVDCDGTTGWVNVDDWSVT